eukprot:885400-Amorphochlora_amoeboformis.AAC.1
MFARAPGFVPLRNIKILAEDMQIRALGPHGVMVELEGLRMLFECALASSSRSDMGGGERWGTAEMAGLDVGSIDCVFCSNFESFGGLPYLARNPKFRGTWH